MCRGWIDGLSGGSVTGGLTTGSLGCYLDITESKSEVGPVANASVPPASAPSHRAECEPPRRQNDSSAAEVVDRSAGWTDVEHAVGTAVCAGASVGVAADVTVASEPHPPA